METDPSGHRVNSLTQKPRPHEGDDAMMDLAARTVATYTRVAAQFDAQRSREIFEKPWLDDLLRGIPDGGRIMDVGCGSGAPIAEYLIAKSMLVTGFDAAAPMLNIAR